jgi:PilZ domain
MVDEERWFVARAARGVQTVLDANDEADLIAELAVNTRSEIQSRRQSPRFAASLAVSVLKGNFSDRDGGAINGTTVDISQGGCRVVFERAIQVGDIYRLDLDSSRTGLPSLYARCVRALMLHDTAIEAGFTFFVPLEANALRDAMNRCGESQAAVLKERHAA